MRAMSVSLIFRENTLKTVTKNLNFIFRTDQQWPCDTIKPPINWNRKPTIYPEKRQQQSNIMWHTRIKKCAKVLVHNFIISIITTIICYQFDHWIQIISYRKQMRELSVCGVWISSRQTIGVYEINVNQMIIIKTIHGFLRFVLSLSLSFFLWVFRWHTAYIRIQIVLLAWNIVLCVA